MREFHRSAAMLVALLLAALPASATLINSSEHDATSAIGHQNGSPLIEFDVEDWVAFISSDSPEYPLSSLGSGIDEFGGPSEFQLVLPNHFDDEPILTQVWNRP
jgi:hypothetical protein